MANRPKGKLFALLAIFVAIGLVTATGAFTTVSAERTATFEVEGDGAALLALQPNATSPNGQNAYARIGGNGQLQLVLNNSVNPGNGGTGLNPDAVTTIDHVFNITNQGSQAVDITISVASNNGNVNTGQAASGPNVYFYPGGDDTTDLGTQTVNLGTGVTQSVGVYFNTSGLSSADTIDLTVTVNADA